MAQNIIIRRIKKSLDLRKWLFPMYRKSHLKLGHSNTSWLDDFKFDIDISNINSNKEQILGYAKEIMNHNIPILGKSYRLDEVIDWHKDPNSSYRWDRGKYWLYYNIIDLSNNADVKNVWELSRFHHLLWLSEAYRITSEEVYPKEIICEIEGWIKENPCMFSINWTCSMEVAIRAVNWIVALKNISHSNLCSKDFLNRCLQSLYEHMIYINNNLETSDSGNANHYFSDIVGLLFLGMLFKDTRKGYETLDFAKMAFYDEVRNQFYPSGFHYEKSIPYHRLMTEMACYAYLLLKQNGEAMPKDVPLQICNILNACKVMSKDNGFAPNFADGDNGRMLPIIPHDFRDLSYLSSIVPDLPTSNSEHNGFVKYDDVGFVIYKNKDIYLALTNTGPSKNQNFGTKVGSHTHCDLLSFELNINNQDIIVDPGTYTYSSDVKKRNLFRSSLMHSTITIDGIEQFEFQDTKDYLFALDYTSKPQPFEIGENGNSCKSGYIKDLKQSKYKHMRTFVVNTDARTLSIEDEIQFVGVHNAFLMFHLAPGIKAVINDKNAELTCNNGLKSVLTIESDNLGSTEIVKSFCSPCYGSIVDSSSIKCELKFSNNLRFITTIAF